MKTLEGYKFEDWFFNHPDWNRIQHSMTDEELSEFICDIESHTASQQTINTGAKKAMFIVNFGSVNVTEVETGMDEGVIFGRFVVPKKDIRILANRFPFLMIEKELKKIFRRLSQRIDDLPTATRRLIEAELDRLHSIDDKTPPMF